MSQSPPPDGQPTAGEQAILTALGALNQRIDRLEARVGALQTEGLGLAAMAADSVDARIAGLQSRGVDVDQRISTALHLAERLTEPRVAALTERLLHVASQHGAEIEAAVDAALGLPGVVATAGDSFDAFAAKAAENGATLDERVISALQLGDKMTRPDTVRALHLLIDRIGQMEALARSHVLDPASVAMVSQAGEALVATRAENPPPMGLFAALSAAGKPEIRKAIGFLLRFAERFGRTLG